MNLSICIPTLMDAAYLSLCLRSLESSAFIHQICVSYWKQDTETIGVLKNYVGKHDLVTVPLSENKIPFGGEGYNKVVSIAAEDILLLSHADHVYCPGWDEKMAPYIDGKDVVSINYIEDFDRYGKYPEEFRMDLFNMEYKLYLRDEYEEPKSFWPLFLSKERYLGVEGFDELFSYGALGEDDLWVKLYRKYNVRFLTYYTAVCFHFSGSYTKKRGREYLHLRKLWNSYLAHPTFEAKHGDTFDKLRKEKLYGDGSTKIYPVSN